MEYLIGSHKRKFGFFDIYLSHTNGSERMADRHNRKGKEVFSKNKSRLYNLIGKKGDVFLFDTMGLHRAAYMPDTERKIFHLNFTNGSNLYKFQNKFPINYDLKNIEVIAREEKDLLFLKAGSGHTYFKNKFISKFLIYV